MQMKVFLSIYKFIIILMLLNLNLVQEQRANMYSRLYLIMKMCGKTVK